MWDPAPWPGIEPDSLCWKCVILTTEPPSKSPFPSIKKKKKSEIDVQFSFTWLYVNLHSWLHRELAVTHNFGKGPWPALSCLNYPRSKSSPARCAGSQLTAARRSARLEGNLVLVVSVDWPWVWAVCACLVPPFPSVHFRLCCCLSPAVPGKRFRGCWVCALFWGQCPSEAERRVSSGWLVEDCVV